MGLFGLFPSLTPLRAAERIRDAALSLQVASNEEAVSRAIGIEIHVLVKERMLLRIGLSESTVLFLYSQRPHPRVLEVNEHLERLVLEYMDTRPGFPKDVGGGLYARAKREYVIQQPHEFAAKMLSNLRDGEDRPLEQNAQASFLALVHGYARETMTLIGELTKKLRE